MEKYVIDLDKVLDEFELNDNNESIDENKGANQNSSKPKNDFGLTLSNDFGFDNVDIIDADFSIQLKPPKFLNPILSNNCDGEKRNKNSFVNEVTQKPNFSSSESFQKEGFQIENEILCDSKAETFSDNTYQRDLHNLFVVEKTSSISDLQTSTEKSELKVLPNEQSQDEAPNISEGCESISSLKPNVLKQENTVPEKSNCDKNDISISLSSFDSVELKKSVQIEAISDDKSNIDSPQEVKNLINDFNNAKLIHDSINDENHNIENAVINIENLDIISTNYKVENENSVFKKNDSSNNDESILNDQIINNMSEAELDKQLNQLDEIFDDSKNENFCEKESVFNKFEISETKNQYSSKDENLQNHIHSNMNGTESGESTKETSAQTASSQHPMNESENSDCMPSTIIESNTDLENNALLETANTQQSYSSSNENENFIYVDSTQFHSNQLEEQIPSVLCDTALNNNFSSINSESRGGLVQNIAYFERQEMPNGLTEEEQLLGKVKPFWIPDEDAINCLHCDAKFTIVKRRHHCRSCGKVLCSQCCSFKAKLSYLDHKEARVCQLCYGVLIRVEEIEKMNGHPIDISSISQNTTTANTLQAHSLPPDPNNPSEYCSTISPLEQASDITQRPLTVMVPVGVLKRPGSNNRLSIQNDRENVKQVMFSDGVRPGGDLTEQPGSSGPLENKPVKRAQFQLKSHNNNKNHSEHQTSKRVKPSRIIVPDSNGSSLPPIVNYNELKIVDSSLSSKPNYSQLIDILNNEKLPWITFGLTKNLSISSKILKKSCCNFKKCWAFSSKGLASVGQDEVLFLLDYDSLSKPTVNEPSEMKIEEDESSANDAIGFPKDVFRLFTTIYDNASKASLYMELSHIFFPGGLFNNKENSGFIFVRPSLQCFQNVLLPSPPFLMAILIHKWEIPWAKVFPLRLVLRLGYEYKMYPTPIVSFANRKSLYFEIGHTIMNVLADFRNFQYTLSCVKNLFIHVEEKKRVNVLIPRLSYEKLCKILSTSNEHVLAFGGCFSHKADSHFVCVQNEKDDDVHGQYHTKLISIPESPQQTTGASFIVFSGALKSTTGLKAKMNIVEDGLLVQILPSTMESLRLAIKEMKDLKIECCKVAESGDSDEWIQIKWVNDELTLNSGVRSQIDGMNLEKVQSARIFSSPDYANERYLIRWIEVFLLQINENTRRSEMINTNRLAESVSQAFCVALIDHLDQLYESGLTKISLRISLDVDKVGYETGSGFKPLPPQFTQPLDGALIPAIMENISMTSIEDPLIIELLFYIINI